MVDESATSRAEFIRRAEAHNANPFGRIGEYQCSIVLTSDEIKPMRVSFEFDWTGDRKTSKVTDVKVGLGL
jgi:hypothetical protein